MKSSFLHTFEIESKCDNNSKIMRQGSVSPMHRVKVGGVTREQLGGRCPSISGRFEQFQYCLQRTESENGRGRWFGAKNFLPFEKFFDI